MLWCTAHAGLGTSFRALVALHPGPLEKVAMCSTVPAKKAAGWMTKIHHDLIHQNPQGLGRELFASSRLQVNSHLG